MRYFVITYIEKANGQFDEQLTTCNSISAVKNRIASIILDFKTKEVVKARIDQPLEKNWYVFRDYFAGVYPQIIKEIELEYPGDKKGDSANTESPSADNESD